MKHLLVFITGWFWAAPLLAGTLWLSQEHQQTALHRLEMKQRIIQNISQQTSTSPGKSAPSKSVARSVLFSALLPGSGQFYAHSYFKSGIFLAAEVTAWIINIKYNNLGDEKDAEFRRFADTYWDEYRYWSFVNYRASQINLEGFQPYPFTEVSSPYGKTWFLINENVYGPDVVEALRSVENRIPGFTHTLPRTKTQQYYEMIGKYPEQFGNAWEDAGFDDYYSGYENRVSPLNQKYTDMRNESNRFYDIAGYGTMVLLINHVVSAIDAGFTTRSYNRRKARMALGYQNIPYKGEYLNMFGVNLLW